jgi:hypothetical protein
MDSSPARVDRIISINAQLAENAALFRVQSAVIQKELKERAENAEHSLAMAEARHGKERLEWEASLSEVLSERRRAQREVQGLKDRLVVALSNLNQGPAAMEGDAGLVASLRGKVAALEQQRELLAARAEAEARRSEAEMDSVLRDYERLRGASVGAAVAAARARAQCLLERDEELASVTGGLKQALALHTDYRSLADAVRSLLSAVEQRHVLVAAEQVQAVVLARTREDEEEEARRAWAELPGTAAALSQRIAVLERERDAALGAFESLEARTESTLAREREAWERERLDLASRLAKVQAELDAVPLETRFPKQLDPMTAAVSPSSSFCLEHMLATVTDALREREAQCEALRRALDQRESELERLKAF